MSRHRRAVAAIVGVAWLGAAAVAAPAHADASDDQFADMIAALDIEADPETLPATGHNICDQLSAGLKDNVNPVPMVRGLRDMLQRNGLERRQASGVLRAAVTVYCPEYVTLIGR